MALELQVNQEIGLLNWNFEQLNQQLDIELKRFQGVVITEEQITEAKKARANLNGLAKAINDRKIQVKKEFCAPYFEFESQVKVLTEKIKEASSGIDFQVKQFEEKEKQEKAREILRFFESTGFRLVTLNQIFDDKWLNKGCKETQWKEELSSKIESIKVDLAIIQQMEVANKEELKEIYLERLDITKAKNEYDQREARRSSLKAVSGENKKEVSQYQKKEKTAQQAQNSVTDGVELYTRAFRVVNCTRQQIIELGNWMNQNGIKFEKIEL